MFRIDTFGAPFSSVRAHATLYIERERGRASSVNLPDVPECAQMTRIAGSSSIRSATMARHERQARSLHARRAREGRGLNGCVDVHRLRALKGSNTWAAALFRRTLRRKHPARESERLAHEATSELVSETVRPWVRVAWLYADALTGIRALRTIENEQCPNRFAVKDEPICVVDHRFRDVIVKLYPY